MIKLRFLFLLLFLSAPAGAEIIFYEFDDPEKEVRFNRLIEDVRCPKCQNNNLADSNAPLSVDLKDIIYDQIHAGASDKEIINFLKERYGDFIYYKPPIKPSTWFIWFGPFILLFGAGFIIMRFLKTKRDDEIALQDSQHMQTVDNWHKETGESN